MKSSSNNESENKLGAENTTNLHKNESDRDTIVDDNSTMLIIAAMNGDLDKAKLLVERGCKS